MVFARPEESSALYLKHPIVGKFEEIYRKRRYEPGTRLTAKPIWADDSLSLQFLDALEEELVWLASPVNRLLTANFLSKSTFTSRVKRIWRNPPCGCSLNSGFV